MKCDHTCSVCGKHETGDWVDYAAKVMIERSQCWDCNYWTDQLGRRDMLVINGRTYSVGPEPKDPRNHRGFLGMAGRRFDITLANGKTFTTHNLWSGGDIPERFRSEFPDNAAFHNGASREIVGGITCFNASDDRSPKYPTYSQVTAAE